MLQINFVNTLQPMLLTCDSDLQKGACIYTTLNNLDGEHTVE